MDSLPLTSLGVRATISEYGYSPSQLLHGSELDLPQPFFILAQPAVKSIPEFVDKLFKKINTFSPPKRNHQRSTFIPKNLDTTTHVCVRDEIIRSSLQPKYKGPFKVISRNEKTISIDNGNSNNYKVSMENFKPAFFLNVPTSISKSTETSKTNPTQYPPKNS